MAEATILRRTRVRAPSIDDPERAVLQVMYQVGQLPPHFVYVPEKEWTKEKEVELIKADMKKRIETKHETIEI